MRKRRNTNPSPQKKIRRNLFGSKQIGAQLAHANHALTLKAPPLRHQNTLNWRGLPIEIVIVKLPDAALHALHASNVDARRILRHLTPAAIEV